MDDIMKIGITAFIGLISSIFTYFLGRKTKIDDILLEKGLPLAENIAKLFQEIAESESYFYEFYQMNFAGADSVEEAVNTFEEKNNLYQESYRKVKELREKRDKLAELLKSARLYLNEKIINDIKEYLEIGRFFYATDGVLLTNNFNVEFFRNITDTKNLARRNKLVQRIQSKLKSLVF